MRCAGSTPAARTKRGKMIEYHNNKFFIQNIIKEYAKKVPQANLKSEACQKDLATYISERIQKQKEKI